MKQPKFKKFDTLSYVKRLKAAEVTQVQAEAHAETMNEIIENELVRQGELVILEKRLIARMEALHTETKTKIATLRIELQQVSSTTAQKSEVKEEFSKVTQEFKIVRNDMSAEFVKVRQEIKDLGNNTDSEFVKVRQEIKQLRDDMEAEFVKVRQEIKQLRDDMEAEFVKVRQEIKQLRDDMEAEFVKVRQEIKQLRDDMETEFVKVRHEIAELRSDMNHRFDSMSQEFKKLQLALLIKLGGLMVILFGTFGAVFNFLR